jgi:adenylate kinase
MENQLGILPVTAVEATAPVRAATGAVLFFGPPGAGKGTQAREMARQRGLPHISTGDLLRNHIAQDTSLGHAAKEIMSRGGLIPDSQVCEMVRARLQEPDTFGGYILDGFPRTLEQAVWLDRCQNAQGFGAPTVAVCIHIDYKHLLRRITRRRACPVCQASYNVYLNPPRQDELCDFDGTKLTRRTDDSEQIFAERIRAYESLTAPVFEHYRLHGRAIDVDGGRSIREVAAQITAAVDHLHILPFRVLVDT